MGVMGLLAQLKPCQKIVYLSNNDIGAFLNCPLRLPSSESVSDTCSGN